MPKLSLSILIVEDNAALAANMYDYLLSCGHQPDAAPDGVSGLHLALHNEYDAIVLDWVLPRMDGVGFLTRLRRDAMRQTPVIMLTAKDQLADKIKGFDAGLDDYLVKPASLPELEVRLRSMILRRRALTTPDQVISIGDLRFDLGTFEVTRAGHAISLSPTARRVLELLMRESPKVVTRERLEGLIWGDSAPQGDILRSHMHLLRKAIDHGHERKLLQTVSGAGYRLCELEESSG